MIELTLFRSNADNWQLYINPNYIVAINKFKEDLYSYPKREDGSDDLDHPYYAITTRLTVLAGNDLYFYDVTEEPNEIVELIHQDKV
jgi:hypothetical protein